MVVYSKASIKRERIGRGQGEDRVWVWVSLEANSDLTSGIMVMNFLLYERRLNSAYIESFHHKALAIKRMSTW